MHSRENDPTGLSYLFETAISTTVRADEDRMTYLNKGQYYTLVLQYNQLAASPESPFAKPFLYANCSSNGTCCNGNGNGNGTCATSSSHSLMHSRHFGCTGVSCGRPAALPTARSLVYLTFRDFLTEEDKETAWKFWYSRNVLLGYSKQRVIEIGRFT